jgi:hypothetical protein
MPEAVKVDDYVLQQTPHILVFPASLHAAERSTFSVGAAQADTMTAMSAAAERKQMLFIVGWYRAPENRIAMPAKGPL